MEAILQIFLITAFLSIAINAVLKKYDLPPIIGYIMAGAFITHIFSLHETHLHILHEVSEFGIAFLMFTIGLEFSIASLNRLKKEVFVFGGLQVLLSTSVFAAIAFYLFELELKASIIIGSALALSSTAIVLKILTDNREIGKGYGRTVLGVLLFQDLAVIPMLITITFFTTTGVSIETMLTETFLSAILLLSILILTGKYLLTPFFSFVFDAHSQELFIGSVLLLAVGTSYAAYSFGFSYSLGAFIGGMLLAETPFKHQVEADLTPFRDLLLGVFFVTVGMQISVDFLGDHIVWIVSIMTAVMLLKAVILFVLLIIFKSSADSLRSAIALSQVGEFSFVVLELARISGITSKAINQTLIIAVVLSMILTPFIVRNLQRIVSVLLRSEQQACETVGSFEGSSHVVVLGYGSLGQWVCKDLKRRGLAYIAIDNKRKRVEESRRNADLFILGNAHQEKILAHANISNAASVIIAVEDDLRALSLVTSVLRMAPHANIIVSGRDSASVLREDKRIHSFVHEHAELSKSMVTQAVSCQLHPDTLSKS
jgi:K+:H+ antiporter